MSATLDPDGRGTIPVCPRCGATTRRDLDTNERRCDLHGPVTPAWVSYTDDDEEPEMAILPDETYADVPQLEWELERKVGACVACGRAVLFVLSHPPIPRIVLHVFDLDTGEPCGTECRHCGSDLDVPADYGAYTVCA